MSRSVSAPLATSTNRVPARGRGPLNNPWVALVTGTYWSQRLPQLARIEAEASYATDEADYYARIEPRVTFCDTLIRCSAEWRRMKAEVAA